MAWFCQVKAISWTYVEQASWHVRSELRTSHSVHAWYVLVWLKSRGFLNFNLNFTEICSGVSYVQPFGIGVGKGSVPIRRQ